MTGRPDRPLPDLPLKDGRLSVWRHPLPVRLAHWVAAASLLVLLMSGLQIFNAHPALYLGRASTFEAPIMAMESRTLADYRLQGVTRLFGREWVTTGLFGASKDGSDIGDRAFPRWATLPPGRDLATARIWHFFFAWVLALTGVFYLAFGIASGRIKRELLPRRAELRGIGASITEHARLHFPKGEAARRYNVLQKLSYVAVLFGLAPLMIATGMSMSPGLDAALPWLPELFGGRQSARTVHFAVASLIVLFVVVHLVMVVLAGPLNEVRSMITGRYVIDPRSEKASGKAPGNGQEDRP